MKELSIEDKARRYDEAVKKLRSLHDDYDAVSTLIDIKEELEHIFPELAEPEDEATWLKKYVEEEISCLSIDIRDDDDRIKLKNLRRSLAWLEKQQKALTVEEAMRDVEQKAKAFTEANKGLTSDEILAQMRGKGWSENESEDEKIRKWLIGYFHQYKEDGMEKYANGLKVDDILAWLEKQGEQKPTWSEEDVAMLDSAIAFVSHSPFTVIGKGKSNVIAWLKSLKDRYTWKPSDEIMKGLNEIINKLAISPVIHEHGYLYDLMVNLRKKLKG